MEEKGTIETGQFGRGLKSDLGKDSEKGENRKKERAEDHVCKSRRTVGERESAKNIIKINKISTFA